MISTPPRTPAHPFTARFCPEADAEGSLFVRTIRDNTHLKPHEVDRYVKALGGWESLAARRELLCEDVIDTERAVLPEFSEAEAEIVREPPPCDWYFPLVALDVGFEDLTASLFGYWDFGRALLVIVDEMYLKHARTDQIAEGIKAKERVLWPWAAREQERDEYGGWVVDPWRPQRRHVRRTSDIDLRLVADLGALHKLGFALTDKSDTKEARINALRIRLRERSIVIHPRCKQTIRHLRNAVWHVTRQGLRTTFEHTPDEGHFDGVDAAVYLNRMAAIRENPTPPRYGSVDRSAFFVPDHAREKEAAGPWSAVFSTYDPDDEEGRVIQ
jgi:hypothetical protein